MTTNMKWAIVLLAVVATTATGTWFVARNNLLATRPKDVDNSAKKEETVKLVVATAKSLVQLTSQARRSMLVRILDDAELRMDNGKKIEIERISMTTPEMIDGMLQGTLKAHIIVPSDDVYLDLLDREGTLRTGKPFTSERAVFMRQPYVIAMRRAKAEAMGWPTKDIGWAEVVEIASDGWKVVGKPEWGPLKMLLANPNYSDTGAHAVVSLARGIMRKDKDLTTADLLDPKLQSAIKAIDSSVVWYPSSVDDMVRNEILTVPARCDMTFLAENNLLSLNEHSLRRKAPPDWVALYPTYGTVVDGVTAAVVQREWVTDEHRAAASKVLKEIMGLDAQKKLLSIGYRPARPEIELGPPLSADAGIDPKRPRLVLEMPPVEVILDCLAAWDEGWKSRATAPMALASADRPTTSGPVSMKKLSHLTPTIQCARRAKPSTITIREGNHVGTGVIIDPRGYAVTNAHVVGTAKTLEVSFLDSPDKVLPGTVVACDPSVDLAIVRLDSGKHPAIKFSDISDLEVGESVVVIGNPYGYTGTVTVGIVSALDREIPLPSGATLKNVIQTDAPINPGNSGGPLLDIDGQLLGIVFAIREGALDIGFAIPVERVRAYIKKNVPE
jgi:S1-C subfamily serine protease